MTLDLDALTHAYTNTLADDTFPESEDETMLIKAAPLLIQRVRQLEQERDAAERSRDAVIRSRDEWRCAAEEEHAGRLAACVERDAARVREQGLRQALKEILFVWHRNEDYKFLEWMNDKGFNMGTDALAAVDAAKEEGGG